MTTSGDKVSFSFTSWISFVVETNNYTEKRARYIQGKVLEVNLKIQVTCGLIVRLKNDTGLWGFLVAYISAEFHSLCCLK